MVGRSLDTQSGGMNVLASANCIRYEFGTLPAHVLESAVGPSTLEMKDGTSETALAGLKAGAAWAEASGAS